MRKHLIPALPGRPSYLGRDFARNGFSDWQYLDELELIWERPRPRSGSTQTMYLP